LQEFFFNWKFESRARFNELHLRGPIYGKALPGRAVMLISSLGITSSEMPIIFEQDKSPKVGFYVPGTLIEVKGDLELGQIKPGVVIVWAWHIIEEVCNYLQSLDFVGEVWTPMPRFEMYRRFNPSQ
jgi:allophanate hydrolase subunit 2